MKKKINIKKRKKTICFDIDNVVCSTKNSKYRFSKPKTLVIKKINELYNYGYTIIFFTSRFMGRTNNNAQKAHSLGFQLTKNQLKKWGVKYHKLIMGKPSYDLIIDDLSIYFKKSWIRDIDRYL
tara:strand:- start:6656 stop:7027 length:372 start_codon:yes stop_codon:yes gene_type:complete